MLCFACNKQERHVTKFGKQISYCNDCNKEMKRQSYRKNPEACKKWHANDYRNNKSTYQDRSKKYAQNNRDKLREYGKNNINARFARAKASAKARNIEWCLTKNEYASAYSSKCYYCDDLFNQRVAWSAGLDRLDSKKSYTIENVVSCCTQCNSCKGEHFSAEETKAMIKLVLEMRGLI